ncbi:hypothetical protein THIOM_002740, partial [Candidatus Thiomargarita nelsonii]
MGAIEPKASSAEKIINKRAMYALGWIFYLCSAKRVKQLLGDNPDKGGHYITVWAPRQTGKTWIMREVFLRLQHLEPFDVVALSLQHLSMTTDINRVAQLIARDLMFNALARELFQYVGKLYAP